MELRRSDSSGTDDDLPPSNRLVGNGHGNGNGSVTITSVHAKEQLVRKLEQDAYTAVLRAFGAQSEVITWDKERLISELRQELRVSNEQHRDFLAKVGRDDSLRQVRELKKSGEGASQPAKKAALVPHTVKRKKNVAPAATMPPLPSSSTIMPPKKNGAGVVERGKTKGASSQAVRKKQDLDIPDSLVGQTIKLRWPQDGNFYQAFVKEFHHDTGMYTLVYDRGTPKETSETVDLSKVAQDDMQLAGTDWKPKKIGRNPSLEKLTKKRIVPPERTGPQKWSKIDRKGSGVRHVVLPSLDSLAKQVDDLDHELDLIKVEHTKRAAKEHEGLLRKVLVEIGESSDEGESDEIRGRQQRNGYSRLNRANDENNNQNPI